jgi:hypothetical protein
MIPAPEKNSQAACLTFGSIVFTFISIFKNRQYYKQSISSEDYSFTAHADGKYVYCFSNEGWTSNSKEVSFNVHGIVYVPESELAQDPLETEGRIDNHTTQHIAHYTQQLQLQFFWGLRANGTH